MRSILWSGKDLDIDLFRPLNEDNASTSIWAPRTLAFTSETFLLSFSLPNFHFHAVTAYDILRTRGVPLGKRDYEAGCVLGRPSRPPKRKPAPAALWVWGGAI